MKRIVLGLGAATAVAMLCVAPPAAAQDHTSGASTRPTTATVVTFPIDAPTVIVPPPPPPIVPTFTEAPLATEAPIVPRTRPNVALLTSGLAMFGGAYAASTIVAASSAHAGDAHLAVPVLGPWLDLGNRGGCATTTTAAASCGDTETANRAILVADGVFQGLGALQFIAAFIFPEHEHKPAVAKAAPRRRVSLRVKPAWGEMKGLKATGEF